jgi:hypothetical protein
MAFDDDKIGIPVEPDMTGFAAELNKDLKKINATVEVNGRPVLNRFKSELNRELKAVENSPSANVNVKPTVTQASITELKRELTRKLRTAGSQIAVDLTVSKAQTAEIKKRLQTQVFSKPFNVQLAVSQKEITSLKNKISKTPIKVPVELVAPSQASITQMKRKIERQFGTIRVNVATTSAGASAATSLASLSQTQKSLVANTARASDAQRLLSQQLRATGQAATASRAGMSGFFGAIKPAHVALTALNVGLVAGIKNFVKFGLESSKAFANTRLAFTGFLNNDWTKAESFMNSLQNFAAVTPFDFESVVKSARLLLGSNFSPEKVLPALQAIGGVGAQVGASGVQVERVTTALAKIAGQGKVTQRELRSIFTAFPGFSPIKAIAEEIPIFGGNTQKALKAISKGAVDADTAINALLKGMYKYPGAASAMFRQSILLSGSTEQLKDRYEQLARTITLPSTAGLAKQFRDAADIFRMQAEDSRSGKGIRELVREGGQLIPMFAKAVLPVVDTLGSALARSTPAVAAFFALFEGPGLEALKAGIEVLPALASSATLFFNALSLGAPIVTAGAKALQAIPAPLITLVAAVKLFQRVAPGGLFNTIIKDENGQLQQVPNTLGKMRNGFSSLGTQVQGFSNQVSGAGTRVKTTLATWREGFNRLGTGQAIQDLTKLQNKLNQLQANPVARDGFFGKSSVAQMAVVRGQIRSIEQNGVTLSQKLRGSVGASFETATAKAKSFGSAALGAFGGPVGLAITALTVGVTHFIGKAQEASRAAKALREETRVIGDELSLDTSASTADARRSIVFQKMITQTTEIRENLRKLGQGFDSLSTRGLSGQLLSDVELLKSGVTDTAEGLSKLMVIAADPQRSKALRKELKDQAGLMSDSGGPFRINGGSAALRRTVGNLFGNKDAEKEAERGLTRLSKAQKAYMDSEREAILTNINLAKRYKKDNLLSNFKQQLKDFDSGKDPSKLVLKYSDSINELAVQDGMLKKEAVLAGLGVKEMSKELKNAGGVAAVAGDEMDALANAVTNLLTASEEISADNVLAGLGSKNLGKLAQNFYGLSEDPNAQRAYVNSLLGQFTQLTGSEDEAVKVLSQITKFKDFVLGEFYKLRDEFVTKLPDIGSIFADKFDLTRGGPGLKILTTRFTDTTKFIQKYLKDIDTLTSKGFGDIASTLAAQGPAAAGKALSEAVSSIDKTGRSKALENLRKQMGLYETEIRGAGDKLSATAREAIAKQYGISPELIIDPKYNFVVDSKKEEEVANQVAASQRRIQNLAAQKLALETGGAAKDPEGNYIPSPAGSTAKSLQKAIDAENKRLDGLQSKLAQIAKGAFQLLNDQADLSAQAINTSIQNANIDTEIKSQVDSAKENIKSLGTDISVAANTTASSFGEQLKKNVESFNVDALIGQTLKDSAKSAGQKAGKALADGITSAFFSAGALAGAKAQTVANSLLNPFRTARTGINKIIVGLNNMGTTLGVNVGLASIPQFHTGGIVGEAAARHKGKLKKEEELAVLKKGEAVLPNSVTSKIPRASLNHLIDGKISKFGEAIGGTNATPNHVARKYPESAASFNPDTYLAEFNAVKAEMDLALKTVSDTSHRLAYGSFFKSYTLANNYTNGIAKEVAKQYPFGGTASIGSLRGDQAEIAAQMLAAKGRGAGSYKAILAYMNSTGVPYRASSTVRPGSITSAGRTSYHALARAVDLVEKLGPSVDSPGLARIFKAFGPVESIMSELIYAGPQVGYNIKNGRRVGKYAQKDHHNHVHAALFNGGIVPGSREGGIFQIGEKFQSEIVLPTKNPERMMDLTTQAVRQGVLNTQGQTALLNALQSSGSGNTNITHKTGNTTTIGDVNVTVASNTSDPALTGKVIGRRVATILRKVGG